MQSMRMSERCERTSEQTSEWPSTYDSIHGCFEPQCAALTLQQHFENRLKKDREKSCFASMDLAFAEMNDLEVGMYYWGKYVCLLVCLYFGVSLIHLVSNFATNNARKGKI